MAQEFKTCMGMLKIPDCLKFVVRHGGHYHMVLFSNTSIYSRNAYKKAVGETFKRRVASSTRNTKAAGQLDTFLHMLYLLSGNKQIIGMCGEHDEDLKTIVRDIMRLKPKAEEFAGITEDQFDSVSLMQEDGGDELCDLNIPQGESSAANVPLPDDDDDLFICKLDTGEIRNAMALQAKSRYDNYESSRKDAATKVLVDCLIDCQVYDMSSLLRNINDMPFLGSFYKNPSQQYQNLILNQARGKVVWNVGIKQVAHDAYHVSEIDMSTQADLSCLSINVQNVIISCAMKLVHYEQSYPRMNYLHIWGNPHIGKTWLFAKGLEWLMPHHKSLTTHSQFQYKELAQPAFYAIADDFNMTFVKTDEVETFKNVLGGQPTSVQEKGVVSQSSHRMPVILLTNVSQVQLYGVRSPDVQMQAIKTRCWCKFHMQKREEHELSDDQLQKIWLYVMFQCLFLKVEDKFVMTTELLNSVRSRLILD